jgi:RNA polymerase sigma factor (sigma-70 family)
MATDTELLRSYARDRSESAFTELVQRHINLVHSAALREAHGDSSMAEDITQAVFAELARKASSLVRHPALAGWLYTCVRQMTANLRRAEDRRQRREQEAQTMNELCDSSDSVWRQIQPVLDDAMHELSETDRAAVALRFFEDRSLKEVGLSLGLNENAARMRVDRALEKLQSLLAKRGVTSTALGITAAITAGAAVSAPTGLAASVATSAMVAGATTTATTLAALKLMTMTKVEAGVIAAIAAASVATTLVIQHQAQARIRDADAALQQQPTQRAQLQTEHDRLSNLLAQANRSLADDRFSELLRLRGEAAMLRQQTNDLATLQDEHRRLREQTLQKPDQAKTPLQLKDENHAGSRAAKNFLLAFILYAGDNHDRFPASFEEAARFFPDAFNADPFLDDLAEFSQATNQFEIVYHGSGNALTNAGNVIVLREKQGRQWPDGKWSRVYGFADGHSEIHGSTDGNFEAFEKQHIVTPPNQ